MDTLTQGVFYGAFQRFLERYNKCIAAGGDYFEGDKSFMCVLSIKVPIRKKIWKLTVCTSYLETLKIFVRLILQIGFLVLRIPLVRMVKFQFLVQLLFLFWLLLKCPFFYITGPDFDQTPSNYYIHAWKRFRLYLEVWFLDAKRS